MGDLTWRSQHVVPVFVSVVHADLTLPEAHHLLMLLHEWDLASTGRHSLTDVYVCLQLLALVRLPTGALSSQGAAPASALALPERPDSRQSNATASSLTTNTSTAGKASVQQLPGSDPYGAAAGAGSGRQQKKPGKRGAISAAWEGLQASGPAVGAAAAGKGGLTLKEAFLKERVAALEAELSNARSGAGAVHSKEVRRWACMRAW